MPVGGVLNSVARLLALAPASDTEARTPAHQLASALPAESAPRRQNRALC